MAQVGASKDGYRDDMRAPGRSLHGPQARKTTGFTCGRLLREENHHLWWRSASVLAGVDSGYAPNPFSQEQTTTAAVREQFDKRLLRIKTEPVL
jgi:hypothetical protein